MRILFPIGECAPLAKVGGLGDVGGSLPKALEKLGIQVDVVLPRYQMVDAEKFGLEPLDLHLGIDYRGHHETVTVHQATLPGSSVNVYLFDNDAYLSRGPIHFGEGAISGDSQGRDRFAFFNLCLAEFIPRLGRDYYDLIHAHDWHTGLLFPLLKQAEINIPTVFTVHNMFYQGSWPVSDLQEVGVDVANIAPSPKSGEENYVNFLVQGLALADRVTTVSPRYSQEIATPSFGEGLESLILNRPEGVLGILNGIDYDVWNPQTDPLIYSTFSLDSWREGKRVNKEKLLAQLGLEGDPGVPLFGMVARLGTQKGIDIVLEAAPEALAKPCQLVILGVGDRRQELLLTRFDSRFPQFRAIAKFDEPLAHKIYAASDFFLIPSKFEPCGITQMIAMRYGGLPIARRVGGLADTISDEIDGLLFDVYESSFLAHKMLEAIRLYQTQPDTYEMMVRVAMQKDFSWSDSAKLYKKVYTELI